jgi:radical SAM-linked protein
MSKDRVAELARVSVLKFPQSGDVGYSSSFDIRHGFVIRVSPFVISEKTLNLHSGKQRNVASCNGSTRRSESMARQRVRIRFAKQGDLRLTSHRDLMRTWERLFRRAGVALAMTEGFHPKPKMMFPSALAVGIEGLDEILEIELAEQQELAELMEIVRAHSPAGLVIHGVEPLDIGHKTRLRGMTFAVEVPAERQSDVAHTIERLLAQESFHVTREGRDEPLELRPLIEALALDDRGVLTMRLRVGADGSVRPREVLAALGLADVEALGNLVRRTAVELCT